MTSLEAYKKFVLKIDNMNTGTNMDIGVGEFVLLYNEWQNKWMSSKYAGRSVQYLLNDIQNFVKVDDPLALSNSSDRYSQYALPSDYLDYVSSYTLASKGGCKGRTIYNHQVKMTDIDRHLKDINNWPSFEYHETPITVSQDNIQVYKTDFSIDSVFLTYYRYPAKIDIAGYTKLDGTPSTNADPEMVDGLVDEVIDLCVLEVQRVSENGDGFQLSKDRITNNP